MVVDARKCRDGGQQEEVDRMDRRLVEEHGERVALLVLWVFVVSCFF